MCSSVCFYLLQSPHEISEIKILGFHWFKIFIRCKNQMAEKALTIINLFHITKITIVCGVIQTHRKT